jgi:hypothetical protein
MGMFKVFKQALKVPKEYVSDAEEKGGIPLLESNKMKNKEKLKKELKNDAGNKHDGGKIRTDLLSIPAIMATADILTQGATEYGDRNWEKGLSFSRVFGALLRHVFAWWLGKDIDPQWGKLHLAHASCCIMFLLHFALTKTGTDDRKISEFIKFDGSDQYL